MPHRRWTTADDRTLTQLHGAGLSCNEIARRMDRNPSVISDKAKAGGLDFDAGNLQIANAVRSARAKELRQQIELEALEQSLQLLIDRKSKKRKRIMRAERGAEEVVEIDFMPSDDDRNLASMFNALTTQAVRLGQLDGDSGVESAKSMLGKLALQIGLDLIGEVDDA